MPHLDFGWKQWWTMLIMMSASAYPRRPSNIVFVIVDDMGWNDVSFHGSDQIVTPNIDALAYQGVILQQYYSEAICTPARTALLTGKYPMRLDLPDPSRIVLRPSLQDGHFLAADYQYQITTPEELGRSSTGMHGTPLFNSEDRGIPLTERLLPSYLKDLGYATHLVGKWHVGMSRPEYLPMARGYDTHYGMRGGFVDYYTYNKVETWPNGTLMYGLDLVDGNIPQEEEQRYIIDALTDRSIRIIQQHNLSQPLFLHITHNAPHAGNPGAPLQPPLYSSVKHRHIANTDRRLYAEVVTHIDRSVGRIVTALAENNLLDDTMIIFVSDNGAPTVGEMRNWGVNLPLRGRKETPWEGAVRVPAFIWHSSFRPRVWNGLMHITDWLPTLLAAAGGRIEKTIDGINQWEPIIQDSKSRRTEVLLTVEDSRNMYASYRAGDFKVIVGNVTGLSNGYYGAELMVNKGPTPEYYPMLRSCEVVRTFESLGMYLNDGNVEAMRRAATIRQEDMDVDATPCEPTLNRGCLFNVRRDPSERHDLWSRAPKVAALLTSRLQGLWAEQRRRGPTKLQMAANPSNFLYSWQPWIVPNEIDKIDGLDGFDGLNFSLNYSVNKTGNRVSTQAAAVNCNGTTGIRNFLCILKSVF